jgi:hypothetical protein
VHAAATIASAANSATNAIHFFPFTIEPSFGLVMDARTGRHDRDARGPP